MTLHERLAAARTQLTEAGITVPEAAVDVDLYARVILGWDRAQLLTRLHDPVPPALEPTFTDWLGRRADREPTAYILGVREFWGLELRVTPDVLIPRPETEFVVEESLALMRGWAPGARIAEIGTGSGCIAVALAHERPDLTIVATDVSAGALAVARHNAERHGVAGRVAFVETSYLDAVEGTFPLIAANPPYVREIDRRALARDVQREPDVALFGGAGGLDHLAGVLDTAQARLDPAGWLVMEFGFGQEDDVRALVAARPALQVDHVREDLQGLARTAIIQRRP